MKVVEFSNGKFGIRTYWFFGWHFQSLSISTISWRKGDRCFDSCQGTKQQVFAVLKYRDITYKIINIDEGK